MNIGLLLLQFLPLLAYIAIDAWMGYRAGIYAAFVATFAMLGIDLWLTGDLDRYALGEAGLILVMGILSLRMKSERLFKYQPAVVAVIFALIFGYFQAVGKPLLVEYLPRMEQLMTQSQDVQNPEVAAFLSNLHSVETQDMFARLSEWMMVVFGLHALVMIYAAQRLSTSAWFLWRLAIYPAMLVAVIGVQLTGSSSEGQNAASAAVDQTQKPCSQSSTGTRSTLSA